MTVLKLLNIKDINKLYNKYMTDLLFRSTVNEKGTITIQKKNIYIYINYGKSKNPKKRKKRIYLHLKKYQFITDLKCLETTVIIHLK